MRFLRKSDGSLTLEAAMVMPFFLIFIVFLVTMIRISVVDMALKQAVSETTEVIATHVYPAALVADEAQGRLDKAIRNYTENELDLAQAKKLTNLVFDAAGVSIEDLVYSIAEEAVQKIVQNKFKESNVDAFFSADKIDVRVVDRPGGFTGDDAYLGISATYDLELRLPFLTRTITIEKKAYERLWTGA
ncbi:TadE-like protein [Evansella caseinilytica]|uniref:TadE-like protein n=1 Tax=Evansella caseinilytica TaxID=1503961 RepID=A0A1H3QYK4_9BACI|nr:TadE/TadG family type IV pilus assembly protein [Evansella caseinilytica]SDZ18048.1 TadE-like protein [Evansella caseinilytica]